MNVIIDRFEGNYAVCEKDDRTIINIEMDRMPLGVKERDVLLVEVDKITLDKEATINRKKQIEELTKDLWK